MIGLQTGAALLAFSCVALGAFGAHALGGRLSVEAQGWWQTATLYGLVHAGVVLTLSMRPPEQGARRAGGLLLTGAAIFAATLYAMGLGAPRWFGAVTPLGGVLMLSGWGWLVLTGLNRPKR